MEVFFCVVLSLLAIRAAVKSEWLYRPLRTPKPAEPLQPIQLTPLTDEQKAKLRAEQERQKDVEALRKQGYNDELIAVILPVVSNGE